MADPNFEIAFERVESLLKSIRGRQDNCAENDPLTSVLTDDAEVATELRKIGRKRELTDQDAIAVQRGVDERTRERVCEIFRRTNDAYAQCKEAALFRVENLARRSLDVIAPNADSARLIAHRAGHTEAEENGKVYRYKDSHIDDLRRKQPALWQAVRAGIPGVVSLVGNYVIVKGRTDAIYAPINLAG